MSKPPAHQGWWDRWTDRVTRAAGSKYAFAINAGLTLLWLASGPFLGWSEAWNFWANTTTTVLTYLMVFLIQHSQNKSDAAVQLKLDELLVAVQGARNELAGVDQQSEDVIRELREDAHR